MMIPVKMLSLGFGEEKGVRRTDGDSRVRQPLQRISELWR